MAESEDQNRETLLKFPCDYTIKIIGNTSQEFEAEVISIVRKHFPNIGEGAVTQKLSKESKYLAMSVSLWVENQKSLDNLYKELTSSPFTIFVL
ncbi:MAG TPA: DUF493 domain-containing protein [Gammaproteobacteria bacterium]|nr:DUF493 domain-containing protein [Gammaproteobacteria bacterium]